MGESCRPLYAPSSRAVEGAEEDNAEEEGRAGCNSVSDKDEAKTRERASHPRLLLHPLAASAVSGAAASYHNTVDPITAAIARQQQQLYRGEPRSPLSPHTLQALCSASAVGNHSSFLSQLTPEDVLAPPPLALTWYPSVPPGVTQHADRKRTVDGLAVQAMARHELDRLAEEDATDTRATSMYDDPGATDVPLQPLRRPRKDLSTDDSSSTVATNAAAAALPVWTQNTAQSSTTLRRAPSEDLSAVVAAREEAGGDGRDSADAGRHPVHPEAHRKRERGERVYEFISHGRRLN